MASMLTEVTSQTSRMAAEATEVDAIRALNAIGTAARLLAEAEALIVQAVKPMNNHQPDIANGLHDLAGDVAGYYEREAA